MSQLADRNLQPELMDDPALDHQEHLRALRGLARVHAVTGTSARLWKPIQALIQRLGSKELTIMDVGCGDGVLLRQIWTRANRMGCKLRLVGCDFSPRALDLCRRAEAASKIPVELHQIDVTAEQLPEGADVIINSLFLHHFTEPSVVYILKQFAASARRLVLIEDLLRSQLGYALCWVGVHLLTRSSVVHTDGPLSVRAAFTLPEIRTLVEQAGMTNPLVYRHWPERFMIEWSPDARPTDAEH
jgi:2-polyprenyl-3-methyl-5-hydroxy-6-metoxy-1,4-benzoquinol methylase